MSKKRRRYVNSGYSEGGASVEKPTLKSWKPQHYSAKSDVDYNLSTLRSRAADLAINSAIGAAAIQTQITGTLGTGLRIYPKLNAQGVGVTPQEARQWSQEVRIAFEMWANSLECDYYRRNNFYELQRIAFQSYLTDGDCFCLFRRRYATADTLSTLRLQLIEAQRVSNPLSVGGLVNTVEIQRENGNRIINGIEVDKNGRLKAIWISNRIYNEPVNSTGELKWRRVRWLGKETGCRNILQIAMDSRTEQYRGVPYLSPVVESLKMISRYSESELTSSIIKTYFSMFFVQPTSNFDLNDILPEEANKPVVDVSEYRMTPGVTISALPKGVDIKSIDKVNAQDTFEQFMRAFFKQIGAALNLPYEVVLKTFNASYSASRASLIQAAEEFKQRRQAFINDFCQPVYEMWLDEAVALGRVKAPGYYEDPRKRYLYRQAEFRTEQSHLIDPLKEAQASQLKIELGLSTRSKESAEIYGTDYWENVSELKLENEALQEATINSDERDIHIRGDRGASEIGGDSE